MKPVLETGELLKHMPGTLSLPVDLRLRFRYTFRYELCRDTELYSL